MSTSEQLKDYPLSILTISFLTGFATTSGLSGATVTAVGVMTKNPTVRRVAAVAWPLLRTALGDQLKDSSTGAVKNIYDFVVRSAGTAQR